MVIKLSYSASPVMEQVMYTGTLFCDQNDSYFTNRKY